MINQLDTYCVKWDLNLNTAESQVMVFRKGGKLAKNVKFSYRGTKLDIVGSYKYLGIKFVTTGNFKGHLINQLGKAKNSINQTFKRVIHRSNKSIEPKLKVFDAVQKAI